VVARSRNMAEIGVDKPADASWMALRDAKNRFTEGEPQRTVDGFENAGIDLISGRAPF